MPESAFIDIRTLVLHLHLYLLMRIRSRPLEYFATDARYPITTRLAEIFSKKPSTTRKKRKATEETETPPPPPARTTGSDRYEIVSHNLCGRYSILIC
jgi:hypothetical protein